MAELAMVHGGRSVCLHPGCVVQVGRVRGMGNKGGVQRLWSGAGGLHTSGPK